MPSSAAHTRPAAAGRKRGNMFTKWTRKEAARFFICFAVFFALVLLTQLPGFLSPLYWALFPILSAFVAAGPLTCVMDMKRGFGSTAVIPLLWLIVYKCIGEFSISLMWIWIVALLVIGEIVRRAIGYEKPAGIRVCVPIMSLVPMGYLIPMFFTKASFLEAAAAELDPAYVAGLDRYGTKGMFVIVLVLSVVTAVISERISEKIIRGRAMEGGSTYVHEG